MRILALKPNGFVLPSIHSSMIRAFRSLGVEVLDLFIQPNSDFIPTLKETCKDRYDAIFSLDLGANHDFILNLKDLQLSIRIPWIIWFVDDPDGYKFPEACEPTELLDAITRTTPELPGEAEALWEIYRGDFRQPLQDLAWIGLGRKISRPLEAIKIDPFCRLWVKACVYQLGIRKRKEVVSRVLESGGAVFGDEGWRDILANGLYRGWVKYGDDLRKIYNHSSFVLDVRQPQSRTGLSQRVFDASACGIPVITEWSPEIECLFDPEEEILSFRP